MKAKDIFNLAVRLLGLVFLYDTLRAIPAAALAFKASFREGFTSTISDITITMKRSRPSGSSDGPCC
jgi:hypothetical protein